MRMEKERLIRVRSESELRVGMLVVVKPCVNCVRASHRAMIVARLPYSPRPSRAPNGVVLPPGGAWRLLPDAHWKWSNQWQLSCTIAEGRLYRVDTGVTDEASPYVAAPRPVTTGAR